MDQKRCISCGSIKSSADFYRHKMMADGLLNKCKECCKQQATANRNKNLERAKAYDKARAMLPHRVQARKIYQQTEAGKIAHAAANKKWQQLQPIRKAANIILNNAVRDKRIIPWPVCAVPECCETKLEAHHPDYERPLDVIWLCNKHHREVHKS